MNRFLNKVTQGDCLELMKELPDNSVDLVLTDPPYGKKWARGKHGFGDNNKITESPENLHWDSAIPPKAYFKEMFRISKNQIVFGGNYFTEHIPPSNCWLVWDKKGDKNFNNPFADCELIWTSFNKVIKKYTLIQQGFVKQTKDERFHPTQKPSELIVDIIKDYTEENIIILDPFIGSGTTAIACIKTNRQFIGFELEQKYVDIANKRIENEQAQLKLGFE